ncbi:hypothetical protein [Sodalis endosymbiont of Henestaris halophilus]|uniref:hypothetical protein n=1 Tax=Sodalis endosymbiont of Henestaris halophilus TaxID=1929246 RepID=UPI0012FD6BDE|nr:hypothetical protein [Sodalis endosymbiont of Henestaris halophilus]
MIVELDIDIYKDAGFLPAYRGISFRIKDRIVTLSVSESLAASMVKESDAIKVIMLSG